MKCFYTSSLSLYNHKERDAGFVAFTAVMFHIEVLWVVTPCSVMLGCQGEDGGSTDL